MHINSRATSCRIVVDRVISSSANGKQRAEKLRKWLVCGGNMCALQRGEQKRKSTTAMHIEQLKMHFCWSMLVYWWLCVLVLCACIPMNFRKLIKIAQRRTNEHHNNALFCSDYRDLFGALFPFLWLVKQIDHSENSCMKLRSWTLLAAWIAWKCEVNDFCYDAIYLARWNKSNESFCHDHFCRPLPRPLSAPHFPIDH